MLVSEESVKVFVRVRPLLPSEKNEEIGNWKYKDNSISEETTIGNRVYSFDKCFNSEGQSFFSFFSSLSLILPSILSPFSFFFLILTFFLYIATNSEIYDTIGRPIIEKFMSGKNGTIFTYGQSGAGKTWTLRGKLYPSQSLSHSSL